MEISAALRLIGRLPFSAVSLESRNAP